MDNEDNSLSLDVLNGLRELQSPDDPEFLSRLLTVYLEYSSEQFLLLKAAAASSDLKKVVQIGHAMKSSCNGIGALKCGGLCASFERLGKEGNSSSFSALIAELESELAVTQKAILALPEMVKKS